MARFLFALVFVMGGFLFCSPTFAQDFGLDGLLLGQDENTYKMYRAIGAGIAVVGAGLGIGRIGGCLLYTSPSPRDRTRSRMPSSA